MNPTDLLHNKDLLIQCVLDSPAYPFTPGHHGSLRKIVWSDLILNLFLAYKEWDKFYSPENSRIVGLDMQILSGSIIFKYKIKNL